MTHVLLLPMVGAVTINHIPLDITKQINTKTTSCMTNVLLLPVVGGFTIDDIPLDIA